MWAAQGKGKKNGNCEVSPGCVVHQPGTARWPEGGEGLGPCCGSRGCRGSWSRGRVPTLWCFHQGAIWVHQGLCCVCWEEKNPLGVGAQVMAPESAVGSPALPQQEWSVGSHRAKARPT